MSSRVRVLVVDDDESIRQLLAICLTQEGYEVLLAGHGGSALDLLQSGSFDLVVSDVRMPEVDGLDLLAEIRKRQIRTRVLMLTGCDDVPIAVGAMKLGAVDYILKPFGVADLLGRVRNVLSMHPPGVPLQEPSAEVPAVSQLRTALDTQTRQLLCTLQRLDEASEGMLEALVTALDARERETHRHSLRVARYTITLAQEMGLRGELLTTLRRGALLHDIGKIGVPDRILLKPGTLSEAEWAEMRLHPEIGARILESVDLVRPAAEIVLCHHEHFDGSGYPRGLKGHEIPLGARIFSVVDSLDAIVTPRPYRHGQTQAEAVAEIVRCRGTQFDPDVVDIFSGIPHDSWLNA